MTLTQRHHSELKQLVMDSRNAPRSGCPRDASRLRAFDATAAAPCSRAVALALREGTREVALIDEAAGDGDLRQVAVGIPQKFLGPFDAALD